MHADQFSREFDNDIRLGMVSRVVSCIERPVELFVNVTCSLEENLAIIGANFALSRAIYSFFRHGGRSTAARQPYQRDGANTQRQNAASRKRARRVSLSSPSQDSMIPLEETIRKTTDLSVSRGPRLASPERVAALGVRNHPYVVADRV